MERMAYNPLEKETEAGYHCSLTRCIFQWALPYIEDPGFKQGIYWASSIIFPLWKIPELVLLTALTVTQFPTGWHILNSVPNSKISAHA